MQHYMLVLLHVPPAASLAVCLPARSKAVFTNPALRPSAGSVCQALPWAALVDRPRGHRGSPGDAEVTKGKRYQCSAAKGLRFMPKHRVVCGCVHSCSHWVSSARADGYWLLAQRAPGRRSFSKEGARAPGRLATPQVAGQPAESLHSGSGHTCKGSKQRAGLHPGPTAADAYAARRWGAGDGPAARKGVGPAQASSACELDGRAGLASAVTRPHTTPPATPFNIGRPRLQPCTRDKVRPRLRRGCWLSCGPTRRALRHEML